MNKQNGNGQRPRPAPVGFFELIRIVKDLLRQCEEWEQEQKDRQKGKKS